MTTKTRKNKKLKTQSDLKNKDTEKWKTDENDAENVLPEADQEDPTDE